MRILEHRPGGPGLDGSPGTGAAAGLGGTKTDRRIGMWSARVLAAFGVAYAVTMVAGFAVMGNLSKPLEDPYLAIKAFRQAGPPSGAIVPALGPDAGHVSQSTDQERLHRAS
jgi:hypothetical protein